MYSYPLTLHFAGAVTVAGRVAVALMREAMDDKSAGRKLEIGAWIPPSPDGVPAPVRGRTQGTQWVSAPAGRTGHEGFSPGPLGVTLDQQLTSAAREAAIALMQDNLTRKSGRPRSREDGRSALDNLLGFYFTVQRWSTQEAGAATRVAAVEAEDPGASESGSRRSNRPKGRKGT